MHKNKNILTLSLRVRAKGIRICRETDLVLGRDVVTLLIVKADGIAHADRATKVHV